MDKSDNERGRNIDMPLREHAERIARAADKQADRDFADRRSRDGADQQKLRDMVGKGRPGRNQQSYDV